MEDLVLIFNMRKFLKRILKKKNLKKKKTKKKKPEVNELLKNVSIPKGIELESIDLDKAKIFMFAS